MRRLGIAAFLLATVMAPLAAHAADADCHSRRLDKVTADGKTVQLDDGSQWHVSDYDQSEAASWQQDASITACEGELINTEEHETAEAHQVKRGDPVPDAD
jgi:hypothetical protein